MLRIAEEALTFDDVLLVPGYSNVMPNEVSLKTPLTRGINLNVPLVSAAMDTVTEADLAIAMAQVGGIGIVHKNMTVEQQAAAVRKVKKYESGVVKDPITVSPGTTVRELLDITQANRISGLPVVDGKDLVGIVTGRDNSVRGRPGYPGLGDHDPAREAGNGPVKARLWRTSRTCCTSTGLKRCWW